MCAISHSPAPCQSQSGHCKLPLLGFSSAPFLPHLFSSICIPLQVCASSRSRRERLGTYERDILHFVLQDRQAGMQAWRLGRCLGSRARQRPSRYARIMLVSALLAFVAYHSLRSGAGRLRHHEEAVGGSLRLRVRLRGERQVGTAERNVKLTSAPLKLPKQRMKDLPISHSSLAILAHGCSLA